MKYAFILFALLLVGDVQAAQSRRSFVERSFSPHTTLVAYSDEDLVGGVSTLTGVPQDAGGFATLWGVVFSDEDKQNAAVDLLFFNASPTLQGENNAQFSISDSELQGKLAGKVSIAAADYTTNGVSNSVGSKLGVNAPIKVASGSSLYVVAVSQGTPTYTAPSSLKFKLLFGQE